MVRDVPEAKAFFALLGFVDEKSIIISGGLFARYMGVEEMQATPRFEIQLLRYIRPERLSDEDLGKLARPGYNHICFVVKGLEVEVKRPRSQGLWNQRCLPMVHQPHLQGIAVYRCWKGLNG
ncbi:VOC family protein [Nitrospira sp. Nam80]